MKFCSFVLAVFLILSFTITSFASELPLEETYPAPIETEGDISYSNDETLNLLLNGMQEDISILEQKVEVIEDEISVLSESDGLSVPTVPESIPESDIGEVNPELGIDDGMATSVSVYSVAPITPEDTSGLKAVLLDVIGDYDPVIVEYEYQNSNNQYVSYLREVLPDYPWCASFVMLALFIYCLFRLGGALIG